MGALFGLLLIICLGLFFGLETYVVNSMNAADIKILGVSLLSPEARLMYGLGIVFSEFVLVITYLLDRVGDTIKDVIKPLIKLVPLAAFVNTSLDTFSPLFYSVLPPNVVYALGGTPTDIFISQAIESPAFSRGILLTLGFMLLFVVASSVLSDSPADSTRVRNLEKENKRLREIVKRV